MQVKIGNIFDSKMQTIVNTINCVGVMGKGIALEFKNKYPAMYKEYVGMCARGEVSPGKPYLYSDMFGTSILNFPTKDHWKSPSKLSYIVDGLDWFVRNYSKIPEQHRTKVPFGDFSILAQSATVISVPSFSAYTKRSSL